MVLFAAAAYSTQQSVEMGWREEVKIKMRKGQDEFLVKDGDKQRLHKAFVLCIEPWRAIGGLISVAVFEKSLWTAEKVSLLVWMCSSKSLQLYPAFGDPFHTGACLLVHLWIDLH